MRVQSVLVPFLAAVIALLAMSCSDTDHVIHTTPDVVQGNGVVVEESRPVQGLSRVDHRGVGKLYIRQGTREELRIRAEENLVALLRTDMQAGELVIWKDGVTLLNTQPIEYHLTVVDLERAAMTGAGRIEGWNLDTGPLQVVQRGAGDVEFVDLSAPSVVVETSGVGQLTLSGSVHEQTVRLGGLGAYDGRDLASDVADVHIANGGSATVRVRDRLTVAFAGGGTVYYFGDPSIVNASGGFGNVVRIGG